jgi:hypothetical protein
MSMASASRPTTPAVLCLWSYDPVDEEEIVWDQQDSWSPGGAS